MECSVLHVMDAQMGVFLCAALFSGSEKVLDSVPAVFSDLALKTL